MRFCVGFYPHLQGSHQCVNRWSVWRPPGTSTGPPTLALWASRCSVSDGSDCVFCCNADSAEKTSAVLIRPVARRVGRYRHQRGVQVQRQEPPGHWRRLREGSPLLVPLFTVQGKTADLEEEELLVFQVQK